MLNDYLNRISAGIKNKARREMILAELESHIKDKISYYEELGYSREEAEMRAVEEMGEAEQTADTLNSLHSVRWYKKVENIIALAAFAAVAAVIVLMSLGYPVYEYSNQLNLISHRTAVDLISFAIFAVWVVLIVLAYKRKSRFVITCVYVFWILASTLFNGLGNVFGAHLVPLHIFEPMGYMFASLVTSGPAAYASSLLVDGFIPSAHGLYYIIFTSLVFLYLLAFESVISFYISYHIKMKPTPKLKKASEIMCRATAVFCAVYLAVFGGFYAYANLNKDTAHDNTQSEYSAVVNFVMNEDLSDGVTTEDVLADMKKAGYKAEYMDVGSENLGDFGGYMYSGSGCYITVSNHLEDEFDEEVEIVNLTCGLTDRGGALNQSNRCYSHEFFDLKSGLRLDDFKDDPLFDKAAVIMRESGECNMFFTLYDDDKYFSEDFYEVALTFTDGKLSFNSAAEMLEDENVDIPEDATEVPKLGDFEYSKG